MDYNSLLPSENKESEIERQIENVNPFFIPSQSNQNNITIYGKNGPICLFIIFAVQLCLLSFFFPIFFIVLGDRNKRNFFNYKRIIILAVFATIYSLMYLYILYINTFKLEISKDDTKNQIIIVRKNYFCCKKIYNILLENAYFYCFSPSKINREYCLVANDFYVLNIFKNCFEIDLENIKLLNSPIKFYYKFEDLGGNSEEINVKLKAWVPNNNYKNEIDDEIKKYKKKYTN